MCADKREWNRRTKGKENSHCQTVCCHTSVDTQVHYETGRQQVCQIDIDTASFSIKIYFDKHPCDSTQTELLFLKNKTTKVIGGRPWGCFRGQNNSQLIAKFS